MNKIYLALIVGIFLVTSVIAGGVIFSDSTINVDAKIADTILSATKSKVIEDDKVNASEIICDNKLCVSHIVLANVIQSDFTTSRYVCNNCNFKKNCTISCIEKKREEMIAERDEYIKIKLEDYYMRDIKAISEVKAESGTITIKRDKEILPIK